MKSNAGTFPHIHFPTFLSIICYIVINGHLLPIVSIGPTDLTSLHLNNVLVSPSLIKNLISIHQFTTNNNGSTKFDPYGSSVKDLPS